MLAEGFRTARVRTLEFVVVPDNHQFLGGYFTSSCVPGAENRGTIMEQHREGIKEMKEATGSMHIW